MESSITTIKVLGNSIKHLRITFLFPSNSDLRDPNSNIFWKFFLLNLTTVYFPIGTLIHMAINIKNRTYFFIERDVSSVLAYTASLYFNFRFVGKSKDLLVIYRQLSDFTTFGKPNDFERKNSLLRKMSTIHFVYHTVNMVSMCLYTFFDKGLCENLNTEQQATEICGLVSSTYLPTDFQCFPWIHIIFLYQLITITIIINYTGIISFAMMESVEHVVIRLNHVAHCFVKVMEEQNVHKRRQMFRHTVRYHNEVIEMAELATASFSPGMMVHISLTCPVFGCAAYRIVVEHSYDCLFLINVGTISTAMVCTAGHRLVDAFSAIGDAIYKNNAYLLDTATQKDLKFVMMRCLKPVYMRAGAFGSMNFSMLMLMAKTTYSYINLLLQTM